ncbi:MAG: hypothetical protein RLY66_79 [Candidatus Parcubacteria bacterium]|jgi:hypothetical protein
MLNISEFFKRVQGKHAKEVVVRTSVCDAIRKYAGFDIPMEKVNFNSDTVVLEGLTAMQKSQIYIKKQAILDEANSQQSIRVIGDIR